MINVEPNHQPEAESVQPEPAVSKAHENKPVDIKELNGPKGPEPTRFGDWERKGRCVDF